MKELSAGTLYQVKNAKGWVIAEYMKPLPAHSYKYNPLYLEPKFEVGPEKIRHVPDCHQFKKIRASDGGYPSTFTVLDKGMETRPVSEDSIAEITRLKQEILQLGEARRAREKELRELCD